MTRVIWGSIGLHLLCDEDPVQSIRGRGRRSGFRLIPVLEGAPLRWPRLREVAFWMLFAGILLRTAEALADYGLEAVLPLVPLSGGLVWIASPPWP